MPGRFRLVLTISIQLMVLPPFSGFTGSAAIHKKIYQTDFTNISPRYHIIITTE